MSQGIPGVFELLIVPPGGVILLILVGLWLLHQGKAIGKGIIITGLIVLYAFSMPITSQVLLLALESPVVISVEDFKKPRADAIVVLGSGRRECAVDFDLNGKQSDTVSALGLERLRYAAWLSKKTHLPVLASGGLADEDGPAESIMMKNILEQEFGVEVRWAETESHNTFENAQLSSVILKQDGFKNIYLVVHALDMNRAKWSFEEQGMTVFPAPTAFRTGKNLDIKFRDFLPSANALETMSLVFHEVIGNIWYRLRY